MSACGSNGIIDVDECDAYVRLSGDSFAQSAHAEAFGSVVSASKVGDAEFLGLVESALAHFSRNEAVAADGVSLFDLVLRCARTPTDASDFPLLRSQDKRFAV